MKTLSWIIVLAAIVLGYVFLMKDKKPNNTNRTPDITKLEKKAAQEPTAEALIDAQFGIPENEAEARYEADMKQNQ